MELGGAGSSPTANAHLRAFGQATALYGLQVPAPPLMPTCAPLGKLLPLYGRTAGSSPTANAHLRAFGQATALYGLLPDLLQMRGLKRSYNVQKR